MAGKQEAIMEEFEEYCWRCGQIKMVHVDPRTNFGDPGFICDDCEKYIEDYEVERR